MICYNFFMQVMKRLSRAATAILIFSLLIAGPATARTTVGQAASTTAASPPEQDYLVYVVSESADEIALVRFGPKGARVDHKLGTGVMPSDIDGPHGMAISRDKEFYYVSLAHGAPFGSVWKYSARNDSVLGKVTLGMFPATMDVSPDGQFLYVVNFNLHGDMVPSSVSVVSTELMTELARIPTCTMPHGSRFNPQGTKHYSVCMMDDMLVEIDTSTLKVSRYFVLTKGKEMGMTGAIKAPAPMTGAPGMNMGGMNMGKDTGGHGLEPPKPGDTSCSPTWAQPSTDGSKIYVACNKSSEIVEIDAATWKMTRRFPTGPGVYNLAVTKDGRLIGTNKRGPSVSVIDLKTGKELARIPTKRRVVHGAVVSPDDRYAFISMEGVGSDPGTVEIIDLQALKSVATVDVGAQAGGIDFLRVEPAR
jgi:DNA-binding beta-propeller fold protein YncE